MKQIIHSGQCKAGYPGDLFVLGRNEFRDDVDLAQVTGGYAGKSHLYYIPLVDLPTKRVIAIGDETGVTKSVIDWSHRHPVLEYSPRPATMADDAGVLSSCGAI